MTKIKSTYRIKRFITGLLAAVMLAVAPCATLAAQERMDVWQASEAVRPIGSGTQEDPYLIATGANLFWLSLNLGKENLVEKWFVQTADIDLGNKEWVPIGSVGTSATAGANPPSFQGHYDGQGHKITGLRLDWGQAPLVVTNSGTTARQSTTTTTTLAYGLFGRLGGTVENLVIEGAEILQQDRTDSLTPNNDAALGILAGTVGDASPVIRNVIVRDSKISGHPTQQLVKFPGIMAGGLIGDLHGGTIAGTEASTNSYDISGIYAGVDVDMSNTVLNPGRNWSNKGIQFYYGGIVGRGRSLSLTNQWPKNVLASGQVDMPLAMVGPITGGVRSNSSATTTAYNGLRYTFATDFTETGKSEGKSTAADFSSNYYTHFKLMNYSGTEPVLETITDDNASSNLVTNSTYSTRTFKPQATFTPSASTSARDMSMLQGVNRGTYVSHADSVAALFDHPGYEWDFSRGYREMRKVQPVNITVRQLDPFRFEASYTTNRPATDSYSIRWFRINSASGRQEQLTAGDVAISSNGNNSQLNGIFQHEDLVVYLFDGESALESATLTVRNELDIQLIDNGFPAPYTYHVSYKANGETVPMEVVDIKVELLKKSDRVSIRQWTSGDRGSISGNVPLTNYETMLRITVKAIDDAVNNVVTAELAVPNYLKISKLLRTNAISGANKKQLPAMAKVSFTDKSNNPVEIDGVNYLWSLTNTNHITLTRGETGEGSSDAEILLPTSINSDAKYLYLSARHPDFLTDISFWEYAAYSGYMRPYSYTWNGSYYQGSRLVNTTQPGDTQLTLKTWFIDDRGDDLESLYGIDIAFNLKDKGGTTSAYTNLNGTVLYDTQLVVEGNNYTFTFPYACLTDLYFNMTINDRLGHRFTTQANFDNYNFKTVPALAADPSVPAQYRLSLEAGGQEHNVDAGMTFTWKVIDSRDDSELPLAEHLQISSDNRTARFLFETGYERVLRCIVEDYYGNKVTVESVYGSSPIAIVNSSDRTYVAQVDGSAQIPAGYTILGWSITDLAGNPFDISHLTVSADKTTITVDDAVTPRRLVLSMTDPQGHNVYDNMLLPVKLATIADYEAGFKAALDGSTDLAGITPFVYRWDIKYDGGESQVLNGTSLATETALTYPHFNASIFLTITDKYSSVRAAARYIADSRTLAVTRNGDNLVALVDGEVPVGGTWRWFGISGDIRYGVSGYPLDSNTNTLTIDRTNNNYNNYYVIWTAAENASRLIGYYSTHSIIYVYDRTQTAARGGYSRIVNTYPNGDDDNAGRTPYTAVNTMERAYRLLDPTAYPEDNIIVIMGYRDDREYLNLKSAEKYLPRAEYNRCATITGTYGEIYEQGSIYIGGDNDNEQAMRGLSAPTVLDDIILAGVGTSVLHFYCNLNDLTVAKNVKVTGYSNMSSTNGLATGCKAPFITVVGGFHNYDNESLPYHPMNQTPGRLTMKFQSGCWGRIIAGSRNNYSGSLMNTKSYMVFGHPDWPHRVDVEIAIKHIKGMEDYAPDHAGDYNYDVGLLVGGVTDGTIFTDSRLYMSAGSVGRFISGNISYGRKAGDSHPTDGFYGSTELTLEGGNIFELVGGTLGRITVAQSTPTCNAFFYGRSILNLNGGRIDNNIYGAGAGGVVGVGTDDNHTIDDKIPYVTENIVNGSREVLYGSYATAKGKLPKMRLEDIDPNLDVDPETGEHRILDLYKSYTEVNLNGSIIGGNVYGGAYGYSNSVQYDRALPQAGYVFGDTHVNMTAGKVYGNLFGGGAGDDTYYKKYGPDRDDNPFKSLANLYGNTYVDISGGIIEGNVYGGSEGNAGLPDMAKIVGDTHLRVYQVKEADNTWRVPLINGEVYGGSQMARLEGNTSVDIEGGAFGNNIYGGSEGNLTEYNKQGAVSKEATMALIKGDTRLTIMDGTYFTEDHCSQISPENNTDPASRFFNLYGGGNINCVIDGDTYVEVTKSLFASHRNLLEKGKYDTFEQCMADDTYRKFSVYGAGRGALADVTGDTHLHINIADGSSVPSAQPVDVANGQQFLMIAGGGFSGNVYGNTNVLLQGNVFGRRAFGGGMYGRVEGAANITVEGGSYQRIFGGGLLGDIMKGSNLTIGVKAEPGKESQAAAANRNIYVYDNVYGGNDVGGIVGYERSDYDWASVHHNQYMIRVYTSGIVQEIPYKYHVGSDTYGTNIKIHGGNIVGSVFGAGNGNHSGYYVPNNAVSEHHQAGYIRVKYTDGPAYLYRQDRTDPDHVNRDIVTSDADKQNWGMYEYRPRTNRVRMHIGGNSETDRVNIGQSVYGGGHACTVGRFNPARDVLTDPSRFLGGGTVKVNFGSHVTVGNAVYMGSRGNIIGKQTVSDGTNTSVDLLESDYDYHYYDPEAKKYKLGFPNTLEGRKRFHAYMKLIDMDAKTQLSFYDDPYITDPATGITDYHELNCESPDPAGIAATDLRFGAFYAGGERGSMTYNAPGNGHCYHYILPEGLTVETRVVGGSEDAMVRFCRYSPDYMSFDADVPYFTYYGGVVYDVNDGGQTGYGGGVVVWTNAPEGTPDSELVVGNEYPRGERVVVKMDVRCQFDPVMSSYTDENDVVTNVRYGGLVYGGCYNSGITNGSVEVICTGNLLGDYYESDNYRDYLSWSSLRHNLGRVYGGGFGKNASIRGRTNVLLDGNFRGFNVFGGGMKGDVSRGTNVTVKGVSKVYNAIYGGSMHGNIGLDPISGLEHERNIGTNIYLHSGGIDRVYGGAFMGDVYGGSHITISDEGMPEGSPRLMVGSVYGGNDITGTVYPDENTNLCTDIHMSEEPRADKSTHTLSHESETEPGKFYSGYPMVGHLYGAGNGNMNDYIAGVTIDRERQEYNGGYIHIANGNQANIDIYNLGLLRYKLPNVESTHVQVRGGTILNLYGGGSMCTVTGSSRIEVNYADTVARAAFQVANQDKMAWGVLRLFEDLQQEEVTEILGPDMRFSHQIYRVFGGNNLMDMAIQPEWDLQRGYIFSLYSGGNFGRMTYPEGLTLTLDSPDLHVASVYGGSRVGNIEALDATGQRITFPADKYGATLNIKQGIIGDVYGGNNVAGTVYNGTNVNITGAISGNVYGSGNGNYIYLYDVNGEYGRPGEEDLISEGYDPAFGGRYFILPPKEAYAGRYYGNFPDEKIVAINSYRPNVEKSFLNIEGEEGRTVFVLGNVFCGGNSSTVLANPDKPAESDDIRFRIGSHVVLGGVFLGSNGAGLANPYNIAYLANLNDIRNMGDRNQIGESSRPGLEQADKSKLHFRDQGAYDKRIYPNILSLYMRGAEVTALPDKFELAENAEETYIGNFTVGGNYGSMMTNETINLELPESLTIMGRVVGGCYNSLVEYNGAKSEGGMPKPLKEGLKDRLNLKVRSKFRPWRLDYDPALHQVRLVYNRVDSVGNYVADNQVEAGATYFYPEGIGNIFGGCFTSGKTLGNINIDFYSDYLGNHEQASSHVPFRASGGTAISTLVDKGMMMNNVAERKTVMAITGAGYGPLTEVVGDTRIRLLPQETDNADATEHPSLCTIFGGAHNGTHIGTSTTEVRDGMVFSSLYGGSRAAFKFGSSEVVVGYPGYYRCNRTGTYKLKRADQVSYVARAAANGGTYLHPITGKQYMAHNADETEVIRQTVSYQEGDIVAANVVNSVIGFSATAGGAFTDIDEMDDYFSFHRESPADYRSKWDNIDINIGDNSRMNDVDAKFYGGGGIYGGGHAINASAMSFSGVNTQLAYTPANNRDGIEGSQSVGYGGNSTIVIGDNPANTAIDQTTGKPKYSATGPAGEGIKDHVSIGTGHYVPVRLDPTTGDKIGHYVRTVDGSNNVVFQHQASGLPVAGETYYRMETEGGVYGDGRRTFVENFRTVDIEGYGYAGTNPQNAKLINTFQRMDMLSLNDCCLQLQGATDYATNAVDATLYSVARVGELQLNSSLKGDIEPSADDDTLPGNLRLDSPRTRNYMGFFHNVHYLGAIKTNTPMDPDPDDDSNEGLFRGTDGKQVAGKSYRQAKNEKIRLYESINPLDDPDDNAAKLAAFKQRNMATAPNMVGINNGYTLKVQNVFTTPAGGAEEGILKFEDHDNIYYGPVVGVVEVKLLTLAQDEGGGYIYAFNQHSDDSSDPGFLEATGNFVYPAAIDSGTDNYIVDDCYPGSYYQSATFRDSEEVHYWYVTGHHYYFNATLTGYTFNGPRIDFRLNNADNLILLSGIETSKSETIQIESINWEEHADPNYKCALTDDLDPGEDDSRDKYKFFLTIDSNTDNDYNLTNVGHAFVAQIPNGNGATAAGTDGGTIRVRNNYSDQSSEQRNTPSLGIHLIDTDSQNQTPEFYHNHLEQPDNVVIKIKAEDAEGKENFYTIRLTVNYLQGPYIDGKINIENCALPGEYIYANTSDVKVEMDESLTVTAKRWYLYPRIKDDYAEEVYTWDDSPAGRVDVSRYLMDNISGDVNRLQLPARYYQNEWKVGYSIVVNGQDFPLPEPDPEHPSNLLTIHNYHRMSTVAANIKEMTHRHKASYPFTEDPFEAKETMYGFDIDLDLVGGALVYIEDDEDFAIFTKYVNYCNEVRRDEAGNVIYHNEDGNQVATLVAQVLPGYNEEAYITGFTNGKTIEGYLDWQDVIHRNVKNPSGGQNIRFVLANDVSVTDECLPISEFRGRLNGMGHNIRFNSNIKGKNFIDVNYGEIHDVGFITNGAEDEPGHPTAAIKVNKGQIYNSYYFNFPEGHPEAVTDYSSDRYASLIGSNEREEVHDPRGVKTVYEGEADNCYQNTNLKNADETVGVGYRSTLRFHNGMVAFNLNQEYLKARYNSRDDDALVRQTMLDASTDSRLIPIDYLYSYYADGEYRFANTRSVEHPEGMRLPDNFGVPNYENYLGNGKTMHIVDEDQLHDQRRWFKVPGAEIIKRDIHGNIIYDRQGRPETTDEGYFPIYLYDANGDLVGHSDFIFFGQDLTPGPNRDYYPRRITPDTRVYRAGGFYGSDTDLGFHFNKDIVVQHPGLTAIDFTGHNDLDNLVVPGKSQYMRNWQFYMVGDATHTDNVYYEQPEDISYDETIAHSENAHVKQLVYYPPVMDLPGGDHTGFLSNVTSFDVVTNDGIGDHSKVTKNLLVYTPGIGDGDDKISESDNVRLFKKLHYKRMQQWGDVLGETNQNDIIGHHLFETSHAEKPQKHFHAANGLFHLVDEQNFNAPIEFNVGRYDTPSMSEVSGRAWMLRKPRTYSNRPESEDPDVFTISKDGWESIALPFTCNRVVAVNSGDYIEKYSRGQITHFYGSDPNLGVTHHDYWLRGLVETAKDDYPRDDVVASAQFARPGASTAEEKLFEVRGDGGRDEQRRGDYEYQNNWFYNAFKDLAYNENHNEYADPMTFSQYCYLTKNAPYIVAYPGEDYYEFDLSGRFYNMMHSTSGCHEQEILYEFTVDEIDVNNNLDFEDLMVRIPVTDDYDAVRNTRVVGADGTVTTHKATFMLIEGDDIADDMYVLNASDVNANIHGVNMTIPAGAAFINCHDFGITQILPFRTYLTVDVPGARHDSPKKTSADGKSKKGASADGKSKKGSSGVKRFITIGSLGAEEATPDDEQQTDPEVDPENPEEEMTAHFSVWAENGAMVVDSSESMQLRVFDTVGRQVRLLNVYPGINRYSNFDPGIYITARKKLLLGR